MTNYIYTGNQRQLEHEILDVYKRSTQGVFHEGAFNYARALCCLRWISVIEVRTLRTYIAN